MSGYLRGAAVSVVLAWFLSVGCGSAGSSDVSSPAATYDLAVFPEDFPGWESHWPAGEPIIAECWRAPGTSHVTIRTRAGERFAFTTALPPELLELDGTIRQAARMFPDERSESWRDAESPPQASHPPVARGTRWWEMPSDSPFDPLRRRVAGSPLFRAVEMAATAACR